MASNTGGRGELSTSHIKTTLFKHQQQKRSGLKTLKISPAKSEMKDKYVFKKKKKRAFSKKSTLLGQFDFRQIKSTAF